MNTTILTSIIAASAACLGALVPCLFSFLGKKKEYEIARLEQMISFNKWLMKVIATISCYYRNRLIDCCYLQVLNYH